MSSQTNKELWKHWIEVWNGNLSIADEIIAPNFVAHFAPASTSPADGSFAAYIKVAYQALRLLPLGNRSSTRAWTSFVSKLGKSSNIGCVQIFCNCCNKSG